MGQTGHGAWGIPHLSENRYINQAVNSIPIEGIPDNPLVYWFRLPFQAVLIAWAWVYTKPDEGKPRAALLDQGMKKN